MVAGYSGDYWVTVTELMEMEYMQECKSHVVKNSNDDIWFIRAISEAVHYTRLQNVKLDQFVSIHTIHNLVVTCGGNGNV